MYEVVKQGKIEWVAEQLSKRLGRPIRNTPLACALAYKEFEDKKFTELLESVSQL